MANLIKKYENKSRSAFNKKSNEIYFRRRPMVCKPGAKSMGLSGWVLRRQGLQLYVWYCTGMCAFQAAMSRGSDLIAMLHSTIVWSAQTIADHQWQEHVASDC
jgi:hypothetical protein